MTDKTERDELIESLRICAKDCDSYSPDVCGTLIEGIGFIAMRHLLNKAAETLAAPAEGGKGEALARRFHETYERLAPSFGYETRKETRSFDPESANGKLMIAVCRELIDSAGGAKVYQCPRCSTSMEVDPTAKPAPQPDGGDGAVADALQFVRPNTTS